MERIEVVTDMDATVARVWDILSDFERYPEWNPFVIEISGERRSGAKLKVRLRPPGGRAMGFRPTVQVYEPGTELRWLGHVGFRGIFDGEHRHLVEENEAGGARYSQSETFAGILVPFLRGTIRKAEVGFKQMNLALKERAEHGPSLGDVGGPG